MFNPRHVLTRLFWLYTIAILIVVLIQAVFGGRLSGGWQMLLLCASTFLVLAIGGVATFLLTARFNQQVDDLAESLDEISQGDYLTANSFDSLVPLNKVNNRIGNLQLLLHEREQQLVEKTLQVRTVLDSMVEGVIALDMNWRIIFMNRAASSLLSITAQNVIGKHLLEVVRIPELEQAVSAVFDTGESFKGECETIRGRRRTLATRCSPTRIASVQGAVLVVQDITELRALETMRRDFVTNVSHELKTPLASISLYAETLRLGAIDDLENRMRFVERIEEQASRLNQLILNLIQLARIESGREVFDFSSVDVRQVTASRVQAFAEDARNATIDLSLDMGDESLLVHADEEAIVTILDNLITNALRYTPANGKIHVTCRRENDLVCVAVSDTGLGIAPEQQERVFERFYRVDKARSSDLGGTGLGLSIVKHLTQSMGGTVRLESRIGRGSKFSVTFPLHGATVDSK
jgi:two-component system phosphate regulon sensor histidine kinase PhoR